jgi:transcriptional regulator with XRE-family HTH domain
MMADDTLPSYSVALRRVVGDRKIADVAEEIGVSRNTLTRVYNGESGIERMTDETRYLIWKKFELEEFYSEDFGPVKKDDPLRTQLRKFIFERFDGDARAFASECDIPYKTFYHYMHGDIRKPSKSTLRKISKVADIPAFRKHREKMSSLRREESDRETRYSGDENFLELLRDNQKSLNGLRRAIVRQTRNISSFVQGYEPDLNERISDVGIAIDIIAAHLDYFREASQEEREKLAEDLDVEQFGYVVSVLGGISKKESFETFVRLNPPPRRGRK